jgi:hypothetical protein
MMQELQQLPLFGSPLSPTEGGALNTIKRVYTRLLSEIAAGKRTFYRNHIRFKRNAFRYSSHSESNSQPIKFAGAFTAKRAAKP